MSAKQDRSKYADTMMYIRYRLEVIEKLLESQVTTGYEITDAETIALQFRKVFEHVVMATLCSNREKCARVRQRFDKMWNASDVIKFVEILNPNFYPIPITRTFNEDPSTGGTIGHVTTGFLSKNELIEAHGRCADLLHVENPYRPTVAFDDKWNKIFRNWHEKLKVLLSLHTIQVVDSDIQWWVVMRFGSSEPVQVAEMRQYK